MDIVDAAIRAIATQSALAPGLAFLAGMITALGPCAAPRMIAAIGLTGSESSSRRRLLVLGVLVFGLCCAYVAIGCVSYALSGLLRQSTLLYAIEAIVLGALGFRTVVFAKTHSCARDHVPPSASPTSLGAAFLLGASMALVISPCCTPIVAAIVGLGVANGNLGFAGATVGAFALGHAIPVIAAGYGASTMRGVLQRFEVPIATVSGALLMGLSAYYAVLA